MELHLITIVHKNYTQEDVYFYASSLAEAYRAAENAFPDADGFIL